MIQILPEDGDEKFKAATDAGITPDPDKLAQLAARTYTGPFRLWWGVEQYLGHGYVPTRLPAPGADDKVTWAATFGSYGALNGYWIYYPTGNKCWQASNPQTGGPLQNWNEDGKANGNPEDWELFVFVPVNAAKGTVRVKNIYGYYVRFIAGKFTCDATDANASIFVID